MPELVHAAIICGSQAEPAGETSRGLRQPACSALDPAACVHRWSCAMPTLAAYLMEGSGRGVGTPEADAPGAAGPKDEGMRRLPTVDTFPAPPAEGSLVAGSPGLKPPA